MPGRETVSVEFEVGTYICPNTGSPVGLKETHPLSELKWPVVVEHCPECGQRHLIAYEDVRHRPVFGYE